jgi:hypothetical protein
MCKRLVELPVGTRPNSCRAGLPTSIQTFAGSLSVSETLVNQKNAGRQINCRMRRIFLPSVAEPYGRENIAGVPGVPRQRRRADLAVTRRGWAHKVRDCSAVDRQGRQNRVYGSSPRYSSHQKTTVDLDDLSLDKCCVLRTEEHYKVGHLLRIP